MGKVARKKTTGPPATKSAGDASNNQVRRKAFLKGIQIKKQNQLRRADEVSDDSEVSDIEAGSDSELPDHTEHVDEESDTSSGEDMESEEEDKDDEPVRDIEKMQSLTKGRWRNRQRVFVLGSRGTSNKVRHLISDLNQLLPHAKTDVKLNKQGGFQQINEMAEYKNCQNIMFFEARKKKDTFLWMSPDPVKGPSVRFLVENVHTKAELRFTGNCLTRSRPILSFHADFDDEEQPHLQLVKLCLMKTFNTPRYHPKSQPFIDHVFNFSIIDGKIWFRNYQVENDTKDIVEIGPRFTLTPACVFNGSFQGSKVWKNDDYQSPNERRRMIKQIKAMHASNPEKRAADKITRELATEGMEKHNLDRKDEVFQ
jgi:ribosome biogenesis protein BRX1